MVSESAFGEEELRNHLVTVLADRDGLRAVAALANKRAAPFFESITQLLRNSELRGELAAKVQHSLRSGTFLAPKTACTLTGKSKGKSASISDRGSMTFGP